MNIIKVMGGLGNQLFQYAFGRVMSLQGIPVCYDITCYNKRDGNPRYPRPYRLDKFLIDVPTAVFNPASKRIIDHKFGFNKAIFTLRNCNLEGYWQYYPYYEEIKETLKEELHIRPELFTERFLDLVKLVKEKESIAVHVRRGDYLVQTWGILPTEYYFEAIKESPNGPLFIFSDDLQWCRNIFKEHYFNGRQIFFVDLEDYLCFELMRQCKHVIMASSTFSWWAAYLNDKGGIIAPSCWLGEKEDPYKLHYPKRWRTIQC
jgi:hypothetical protein